MNKLEQVYAAIKQLEALGLPISDIQKKAIQDAERSYISEEFLPSLEKQAEKLLTCVQSPLDINISYSPNDGIKVTLLQNNNESQRDITEADKKRYAARYNFWEKFIEYNKERNAYYSSFSPSRHNWMGKKFPGLPGCYLGIEIMKDNSRINITIDSGDKSKNERIFDKLYSKKKEIESITSPLKWERLNERKSCRISLSRNLFYQSEHELIRIFDFFIEYTDKFLDAFGKQTFLFK